MSATNEPVSPGSVLTGMLHAIDALDWTTLRASFAADVAIDYTSLFGGEPETITGDDLVARWRPLMRGYDATQHLTGPVLVSGDRLDAHVVARHWIADAPGGDTWTVYGHYVVRLVGDRIAGISLLTFHQDGNRDLPNLATERSTTSAARPG